MAKVYRFQWQMSNGSGQRAVTGMHWNIVPEPLEDDPAASDVLTGLIGHMKQPFLAFLDQFWLVESASLREAVQPGSGAIGDAAEESVGEQGANTYGGSPAPDAVSLILSLHTNAASRNARGYMALPGPNHTSAFDNNNWTSATLAYARSVGDTLLGEVDFGSVFPAKGTACVYSRTRHAQNLTPYVFGLTGYTARQAVHWRESRSPGK